MMRLYQSLYLLLPMFLFPAQAAGNFAILFWPQQSFTGHSHGDQSAMLLCGIAPQFSAMCVAQLHPTMIAATGHCVEIDPIFGCAALAHCVIVMHETAFAIVEPIMHTASQICFVIEYPGHEIFKNAPGVLI